jgi:hypothetical protein
MLELNTADVENATSYFTSNGVETCDELEKIPENLHWITHPEGTVFIAREKEAG